MVQDLIPIIKITIYPKSGFYGHKREHFTYSSDPASQIPLIFMSAVSEAEI